MAKSLGINNAMSVDELVVRINGYDLEPNNISSIQINFGGESKNGTMVYLDNSDLCELANANKGVIFVSYKDFAGIKYSEKFIITRSIKTNNTRNRPVVTIEFEDEQTAAMRQTFINFAFKEKTPIEIVAGISDQLGLNFSCLDIEDADKIEKMVVPTNTSLLKWLTTFAENYGLQIIRDKYSNIVVNKKLLYAANLSKSKEGTFNTDDNAEVYNRVLEIRGTLGNRISSQISCQREVYDFDIENSVIVPEQVMRDDDYIKQKLNDSGNPTTYFPQYGEHTSFNIIPGSYDSYTDMLLTTQISNIVTGAINIDRTWQIITLGADRVNTNGQDKIVSGDYVVKSCSDKITSGTIVSKLTLARADHK